MKALTKINLEFVILWIIDIESRNGTESQKYLKHVFQVCNF